MKIAGIELPKDMAEAVEACRPHFVAAAVFSLFINLLFLAPAIYMLQVYDRVVATGGKTTLLFITLALAMALLTLSALDAIRNRLLVRASMRLDALLAPKILKRMMARNSNAAVQAMRDFETDPSGDRQPGRRRVVRRALVPVIPAGRLPAALLDRHAGGDRLGRAVLRRLAQPARDGGNDADRDAGDGRVAGRRADGRAEQPTRSAPWGWSGAMVNRQLRTRAYGLNRLADAQFTGGRYSALSRFLRLFVQSAALGLGALAGDRRLHLGGRDHRRLDPAQPRAAAGRGRDRRLADARSGAHAALERLADVMAGVPAERIYTALPEPAGRIDSSRSACAAPDGRAGPVRGHASRSALARCSGSSARAAPARRRSPRCSRARSPPRRARSASTAPRYDDWEPDELARHIGYLPQEPSLFEGTIKENISRFSGAAQRRGRRRAGGRGGQGAPGVHELILQLPEGL